MEPSLYATVPGIPTIIQCHSISEEVFGILGNKNIASFYLFSCTICLFTLRVELDSIPTHSGKTMLITVTQAMRAFVCALCAIMHENDL